MPWILCIRTGNLKRYALKALRTVVEGRNEHGSASNSRFFITHLTMRVLQSTSAQMPDWHHGALSTTIAPQVGIGLLQHQQWLMIIQRLRFAQASLEGQVMEGLPDHSQPLVLLCVDVITHLLLCEKF